MIQITDDVSKGILISCARCEVNMPDATLVRAVERLAQAGEQAGFSVENMIHMLNAGLTVETLLDIIDQGLRASTERTRCSSHWII